MSFCGALKKITSVQNHFQGPKHCVLVVTFLGVGWGEIGAWAYNLLHCLTGKQHSGGGGWGVCMRDDNDLHETPRTVQVSAATRPSVVISSRKHREVLTHLV